MTNREIKKLQEAEGKLWRNLKEQEYELVQTHEGLNYHLFTLVCEGDMEFRSSQSAWCSVYELLEAFGIESDFTLPDAQKAFELYNKVWELTTH